jgi:hypothetical protein
MAAAVEIAFQREAVGFRDAITLRRGAVGCWEAASYASDGHRLGGALATAEFGHTKEVSDAVGDASRRA